MMGAVASFALSSAAIGCAKFITAIAEARENKASMFQKNKEAFDRTLDSLNSTLRSIQPSIREMERLNHEMGCSKKELEPLITKMEEGIKLLKECSKLHWESESSYMAQLHVFDDSFRKLLDVIFKVQAARDQKEMLHLKHQNRLINYSVLFFLSLLSGILLKGF